MNDNLYMFLVVRKIYTLPKEIILQLMPPSFSFRHNPGWRQPDADVRPDRLQDRPGAEQDPLGAIGNHLVNKRNGEHW